MGAGWVAPAMQVNAVFSLMSAKRAVVQDSRAALPRVLATLLVNTAVVVQIRTTAQASWRHPNVVHLPLYLVMPARAGILKDGEAVAPLLQALAMTITALLPLQASSGEATLIRMLTARLLMRAQLVALKALKVVVMVVGGMDEGTTVWLPMHAEAVTLAGCKSAVLVMDGVTASQLALKEGVTMWARGVTTGSGGVTMWTGGVKTMVLLLAAVTTPLIKPTMVPKLLATVMNYQAVEHRVVGYPRAVSGR
jgi:hypothetical protein